MKEVRKTNEYEIDYTGKFLEDIEAHKKIGNKSILVKIDTLINELRIHPTTGTGKPEALKGVLKEQWSRRITGKHRLVYQIEEKKITVLVLSAYGHYEDK